MPETARIIGVFTDHAPYSEPSGPYDLVLGIGNVGFRESGTGPHCPAGSPPNPTAMEAGVTDTLREPDDPVRMIEEAAPKPNRPKTYRNGEIPNWPTIPGAGRRAASPSPARRASPAGPPGIPGTGPDAS